MLQLLHPGPQTTRKDSRTLATLALFAAIGALNAIALGARQLVQVVAGVVRLALQTDPAAADPPSHPGPGSIESFSVVIRATELGIEPRLLLASAALAWTVAGVAILGSIAVLALSIRAGEPFSPAGSRCLRTVLLPGLGAALVGMLLQLFGTNWAIGDLGLSDIYSCDLGALPWLLIGTGLVLGIVDVAHRTGERLARDSEGLV